jgi:glycosyltransferase involved in cell wall biosynthesis
LTSFSEVIVLDTGSTDNTLKIAKKHPNVKIFEMSFCGFGKLRNQAALIATHDWILAIDSDEVLSKELISEIQKLSLTKEKAYSFPRLNFYQNKQIKGCGWHPERVTRLYHRKIHKFHELEVHESLDTYQIFPLSSPLLHTPYLSTEDFLHKMQHYSTLFANQYGGKKKYSLFKSLWKAAFTFFRSYLLRRGIFDGSEGIIISLYNANTTFYKYIKLMEVNSKLKQNNKLKTK